MLGTVLGQECIEQERARDILKIEGLVPAEVIDNTPRFHLYDKLYS